MRPSGLLCYYEYSGPRSILGDHGSSAKVEANLLQLQADRSKAYSGILSEAAIKRMRKAIQIMVASAKWKTAYHRDTGKKFRWKINFITLTLSSAQGEFSDTEVMQKCFQPMLRIFREKFGVVSYVWRAERQENGNIHYHIMADTWCNWRYVRTYWNRCQNKLGFIDSFAAVHGHRDPNSTDIHSVKAIRNLAAYMAKYMAKNAPKEKRLWENDSPAENVITGKVWDCSMNLKTAKFPSLVIDGEVFKAVNLSFETFNTKILDADFSQFCVQSDFEKGQSWAPIMKTTYRAFIDSIGSN